jgi:hypothetical protein
LFREVEKQQLAQEPQRAELAVQQQLAVQLPLVQRSQYLHGGYDHRYQFP